MAARPPRSRGPADPSARRTVKTSLTVDGDLHARWSAAASLRGQDRNAFAVDVLRNALKSIVIIDRSRKPADPVTPSDEVDRESAA